MSEDPSDVTSILLFTTSSLVVVNRFSAVVALVTSLFTLAVIVASPLVRSVVSVLRLVVKTPSALVALVTSLFKLEVIVASPLVRSVVSVARLLVKTPSALVALLTSAVSAVKLPEERIYIILYRFYTWIFGIRSGISCNVSAFVGYILFDCC